MVVERVASGGARVAGRGIGTAIGSFFTNPAVLILAALGIGLFVFRDKISQFIQDSISGFELPDFSFPDFSFPDITFPDITFPTFEFPSFEFPDFPNPFENFNLCSLFGIGCNGDQEDDMIPTSPEVLEAECTCGIASISQDITGQIVTTCKACPPELSSMPPPPPEMITPPPPPIELDPELELEGDFVGGGPSFIGGSIGQTPVTTLFQVLDLFSGFSASQAANFLFQFSGISPSEALKLEQFQEFI